MKDFLELVNQEHRYFRRNILYYLLCLYVTVESYRTISGSISNGPSGARVFSLEEEALIRGVQFPLVVFLLLSGFLVFTYFRRERLPENRGLFFSKPLKTGRIILARFAAASGGLTLIYAVGVTAAITLLRLQLSFESPLNLLISAFIALPFFTIIIWTAVIFFIGTVTIDFRIALPLIFIIWFSGQLMPLSYLVEYNKIESPALFSDSYLITVRAVWLAVSFLITAAVIYTYDRLRGGAGFSAGFGRAGGRKEAGKPGGRKVSGRAGGRKKSGKPGGRKAARKAGGQIPGVNTGIVKNTLPVEGWYSLKIYSGWRIIVSVSASIILALVYSLLLPAGYRVFLYTGSGEIFLSILAILGTAGISQVEGQSKTKPILFSLPDNAGRLLKEKLLTAAVYFLATTAAYIITGAMFISPGVLSVLWLIIPPYIFFAVLSLVFSSIFNSAPVGAAGAGILWFLPLVVGRRYPYWIHPFYYFAEFEHYGFDFMLENRLILLLVSIFILAAGKAYLNSRKRAHQVIFNSTGGQGRGDDR